MVGRLGPSQASFSWVEASRQHIARTSIKETAYSSSLCELVFRRSSRARALWKVANLTRCQQFFFLAERFHALSHGHLAMLTRTCNADQDFIPCGSTTAFILSATMSTWSVGPRTSGLRRAGVGLDSHRDVTEGFFLLQVHKVVAVQHCKNRTTHVQTREPAANKPCMHRPALNNNNITSCMWPEPGTSLSVRQLACSSALR